MEMRYSGAVNNSIHTSYAGLERANGRIRDVTPVVRPTDELKTITHIA